MTASHQTAHGQLFHECRIPVPFQHFRSLILFLILVVKFQIIGKIPGYTRVLDILSHRIPVHGLSQLFSYLQESRKILPASGRRKLFSVHSGFHLVKIPWSGCQIGNYGRMDVRLFCILFPYLEIRFHIHAFDPVQRCHVKLSDGFIVLRRISR